MDLISFIYFTSEELFYVADCFFFLSFPRMVRRGVRRGGHQKKKKKKRRGEERKIPSDRECVRARERDETPAAPQSGLHLSTGPQWIQPTD